MQPAADDLILRSRVLVGECLFEIGEDEAAGKELPGVYAVVSQRPDATNAAEERVRRGLIRLYEKSHQIEQAVELRGQSSTAKRSGSGS